MKRKPLHHPGYGESTSDTLYIQEGELKIVGGTFTKDVKKKKHHLPKKSVASTPAPAKPKVVRYWRFKTQRQTSEPDNLCVCPVCKIEFRPGPYSQHMKSHLRRGEVTKREIVRPEHGNVAKGYLWSNPFEYVVVKGG